MYQLLRSVQGFRLRMDLGLTSLAGRAISLSIVEDDVGKFAWLFSKTGQLSSYDIVTTHERPLPFAMQAANAPSIVLTAATTGTSVVNFTAAGSPRRP